MRKIANDYLKKVGKRLIKSKETCRSWGKCRNKRSRQARQHRGRNLWSYLKPQKNLRSRHINVHYNRAHIKNYTRFAFGNMALKHLVCRRAMDDKAYIRCGTSEGFSRPLHRPVQVVGEYGTLPSSDYPDPVGYVSPGVILMVNDMKEVEHRNSKSFVPTDVTVSVTCKPKKIYPSTATNWANDMVAVRYLYRDEHEISLSTNGNGGNILQVIPGNIVPYVISLRDSLMQFELMNIKKDYTRVVNGGDHLARESLRITVLLQRINNSLEHLETIEDINENVNLIVKGIKEIKALLHLLGRVYNLFKIFITIGIFYILYEFFIVCSIFVFLTGSRLEEELKENWDVESDYEEIGEKIRYTRNLMDSKGILNHRFIGLI